MIEMITTGKGYKERHLASSASVAFLRRSEQNRRMPNIRTDYSLTAERLRELLHYDPQTGVFTWRKDIHGVKRGDIAGSQRKGAYRHIKVDGLHVTAQRLAWLYVHGVWPDRFLRFKDGDRTNLAIDNLRYPDFPHSKESVNAYSRHRTKRNPEMRRGIKLRYNFGIGLEDYQKAFVAQGGVCAICKKPETKVLKGPDPIWLAVDHCHETGRFRGLLCYACNTSVGHMGEDPARLRAAADYIEKAREAPAEEANVIRLIPRKVS